MPSGRNALPAAELPLDVYICVQRNEINTGLPARRSTDVCHSGKTKCHHGKIILDSGFGLCLPLATSRDCRCLLIFAYLWKNAVHIYVSSIFRSPFPHLRGRLFGFRGGCLHSGCGTTGCRHSLYARWSVCARREKRRARRADTRFAGTTTFFEGTCCDPAIQNSGGESFCRVA